ncbi:hypothetical protein [Streptomyces violaceorubidus]|uniref:hypothetical protein n=1 Tax=Streptomyces violaceorubidus TaxID=284042 RepID=UPI0004C10EC3|nr:hypothetical protein [Streptomyces violaceorubidus]
MDGVDEWTRRAGSGRYPHVLPGADRAASGAVCRGAGLGRLGQVDFEYPQGHRSRSNDWRVDPERGD